MEVARHLKEVQVGIAEYKVAREPRCLITLGLGSCVGVTLYDPVAKIGGLLHIMLPDSAQFKEVSKPAKFADLGIPLMLNEVIRLGAKRFRLQAKLAGGAQMFSGLDKSLILNIGERNVEMAKKVLKNLGIKIIAEDVGGNQGRTMIFNLKDGQVFIRILGGKPMVI